MNNVKQCIIIGGGTSLSEGISMGLWDKIKGRFVIGINHSYDFYPDHTFMAFMDNHFLEHTNKNDGKVFDDLKTQSLIITRDHSKQWMLPNMIIIKSTDQFNRNMPDKRAYKGVLTGIYSLTLAIHLLDEGEIFLCYDNKTEVFTDSGWKFFKDLQNTDKILTRKSSGDTEWSSIYAKQIYNYNGKMYKIKSRGIDLVVTPNHRFCLETDQDYTSKFCNFHSDKDGYIWRTPEQFTTTTHHFIPKIFNWTGVNIKYFYLDKYKIKMNIWIKFLGLYLSEGCCIKKTYNNYLTHQITIYQTHTKIKDKYIESCLNKLPFHFYKTKRGWVSSNKILTNYLIQFGKSDTKFISTEFKNLDKKYLNILLQSLIFGDGYIDKNNHNYYYTVSKQLADDVQEIAYKCGYHAEMFWRPGRICKLSSNPKIGLRAWTVYFNNSKKQGNLNRISVGNLLVRKNIEQINYNEKVYDITVKNHTLFVRRNNICVWSGNCGYDFCGDGKLDNKDKTHWYQGKLDHKGIGKVSYYNSPNRAVNDFKPFLKETKCKIWNVSLISKLPQFEKISYEQFFQKLDDKIFNQDELRKQIREKLQ